jgi:hypothetical protein
VPIPPATSEPVTDPGVGFVTFPKALVNHKELTDFDVRLLLLLDQIGWLEGQCNGAVHASNEEIAIAMGKSPSTVKAALKRIEAIRPPILKRGMSSSNSRAAIYLVYDRYGSASVTPPKCETLPDAGDVSQVAEKLATLDTTATTGDGLCREWPKNWPPKAQPESPEVAEKLATRPIIKEQHHHHHAGGVAEKLATYGEPGQPETPLPSAPATATGLIDWLPSIASEDPKLLARLTVKVPLLVERVRLRRGLAERVAVEWVQDALLDACDKDDPVTYATRVLKGYVEAGGRPGIEIPRVQAEPEPDAPTMPMPAPRAVTPRPSPGGFAPRPTAAERNASIAASRREAMSRFFQGSKEASDGR